MGDFIYLIVTTAVVAITSLSVGLGESITSLSAIQAINIQPEARAEINKTMILGVALTETAAIIGLIMSLILLANQSHFYNSYASLAHIGIALAICVPGAMTGFASALPTRAACFAIARQPFFGNKIMNIMLLTVSFIQTPIIFGFIIALFAHSQAYACTTLPQSLKIIASGLSLSLGSIGPIIGLSKFAESACKGVGVNREAYSKLLSFTIISEALIETPLVFALIISLLIISISPANFTLLKAIAAIAAALATGLSNIAPGISSGRAATSASLEIAKNPSLAPVLSKTSLIAQGLIDSFAIYGWAIALFLLTFT